MTPSPAPTLTMTDSIVDPRRSPAHLPPALFILPKILKIPGSPTHATLDGKAAALGKASRFWHRVANPARNPDNA